MKALLNSLLAGLREMLSDATGGISTMRVLAAAWLLLVVVVWTYVSLVKGALSDIPAGVQWITGLVVAGKVIQRPFEKSEPATATASSPATFSQPS